MKMTEEVLAQLRADGWEPYHTGGGCMALRIEIGPKDTPLGYALCTEAEGGTAIPEPGDDTAVGLYLHVRDEAGDITDDRYCEMANGRELRLFPHEGESYDDPPIKHVRFCFVDEASDIEVLDPFLSTCGRFVVDPMEEYGVPTEFADLLRRLNRIEEHAVDGASAAPV